MRIRSRRRVLAGMVVVAALAFLAGCGTRQVTDTIYFKLGSSRTAEGALIRSLLNDPAKSPPQGVERFQPRGLVAKDPGPPRVIVTFRKGTSRADIDSFNQPFFASGLVDRVTVHN